MKNIHFKNLNLNINSGELIGIIGSNGSGKTILLKMISGRIKNNYIFIDDKSLNDYSLEYKKNNIVCVFDDNIFYTLSPRDELKFYLNKLNKSKEEIEIRFNDFMDYFNLSNIIDEDFVNLSIEIKSLIKILSLLIINPYIFCIDDMLTYLSMENKIKILNYIKDKNITLLCVTSNMEELLLLDKILVINKGEKAIYDKVEVVLGREDIFKDSGLSLPFIYDINNMLKSYELIDDEHIVYKELVDILWK